MPKRSTHTKTARKEVVVNADSIWQDAAWRARVRKRLLAWFPLHARTLPWRSNPEPYWVWVSEIMCQQTQIGTVLPYFERFIDSFPSIQDLADASETELLRHWEGLGYYRRARSMHAAAKQIVAEHGGVFPDTFDEVIALPGIGRYTAGAILSISGDQRVPILEGNTQRVFSRWISLRDNPTSTAANKVLWEVAEAMLPRKRVGEFNQAAMELGSLVCFPREPNCAECPVQACCTAFRDGLEKEIPGKVAKTKYQDRTEFAFVVVKDQAISTSKRKYLMRPLPDGGRWAGLWDFPRRTDQEFDAAAKAAKVLSLDLGQQLVPGVRLQTIKHAVTKYRISLHVHAASVVNPIDNIPKPWRFVTLKQMAELPMSVTGRKIASFLTANDQLTLPLQTSEN